ncbi:Ribosomal RNA small subunit methyltransferase A [Carnobacterium maltaromaticum]|jgi:16S rRNA (adenine1518-N6/adenine1519-N6)-dimethyltransferase|nr:dimethyladenosine transferase [Carnobacterium maltaromaticum]CRH22299.1 Ribosomal RNA small subunit methyltransferase A [Carnobacterium maltaromaticum]
MKMTQRKDIATPSRTKEILAKHGFSVKKSLGQNFIVDPNILVNIVAAAGLDKDTNVVEVGPGIGALTEHLARASKEVVAFEIDDRLLPVLADTLSPYDNVEIVHTDVLKANLAEILTPRLNLEERLMVVANLPYYITTPIIMHFLESEVRIDGLVIMTQKEVGDRITAAPGTKAYGSLSIAIQYYMEAEIAFIVPKTVFVPQPNVDSAIIKLTRREQPSVIVKNEKIFFQVARAAFVQRRKTLWNNLLVRYGKEEEIKEKLVKALELADIDPKRRGETLSLAEFGRLSDAIVEFFPENN